MSPPPVSFTISPLLWISGLVVLLSGLALLAYFLSRHGSSSSAARIGVLSAVGLLITAGFLYLAINHDQPERVREAVRSVERAHEVNFAAERLLSAVQYAEISQRNSLISREPQYVEAWKQAREEVALRMALLRTLVRDRTQQERLTEVERLIGARLEVLDESFQQARTGNVEAAFAIIRAGAGNEIMQGVQSALAEITSGNARLLAQRREAADKERQGLQDRFRLITGVGIVLFVLFAGTLGVLTLLSARTSREIAIAIERAKNDALRANEARLRHFIDSAPAAIAMFDRELRFLAVSRRFIQDYRLNGQAILGRCYYELLPNLPKQWRDTHQRCLQGAIESSSAEPIVNADGTVDWVRWEIHPWRDGEGAIGGLTLFSEDVTDRKRAEDALFREKERAQVTLHSIGDAVITTDTQGRIEYLNPVAETLTGWTRAEAGGQPLPEVFKIINEADRSRAIDPVTRCLAEGRIVGLANHTILVSRDGTERAIADSAAPIHERDGNSVGAVLVFHDVSETRRLARQLEHDAAHDALTGLVNRREFEARLRRSVDSAQRQGVEHALCYFDLDQFKLVNDTAGHAAGDALLKQVRELLAGKFRERDTLARLGGDEFALLLENCQLNEACRIAEVIVAAFRAWRFTWGNRIFQIGASAGVISITSTCKSAQTLLSEADVACYAAKEQGRGRVHVYRKDGVNASPHHAQMLMAATLRDALAEKRFCLYAQPIVPLATDNPAPQCYEILLRMLDTEGSIIPPAAFIPAAERYGLMAAIDRWVIEHAIRAYASLDDQEADTQFAINLSGESLTTKDLAGFVLHQFATHDVRSDRVCFEITETAAIQNLDSAQAFIAELRSHGSHFSLDDFGSGLSSFRYLRELPADYLKIDGSFVRNMSAERQDQAVVEAINEVGHTLGIRTVAEYAHDTATVNTLRLMGVDYAQGYALGTPEPLEQLLSRLGTRPIAMA